MAKCVENVHTGKVLRVSDDEAHEMTKGESHWSYVPKSVWKQYQKTVREAQNACHDS